jgi:uncharacterized protein DUF6630
VLSNLPTSIPPQEDSVPMTARDALVAIAVMLAPDRPAVAEQAAAAHDDPHGFVRRHAKRLANRGISEPIRLLPWIALVDALADHHLLAEVDWRENPDEIVRMLRNLDTTPQDGWDWMTEADVHLPTERFLKVSGDHLRTGNVTLASLDIDSDCYPLVVLPAARTDELLGLAALARYRVSMLATKPGSVHIGRK